MSGHIYFEGATADTSANNGTLVDILSDANFTARQLLIVNDSSTLDVTIGGLGSTHDPEIKAGESLLLAGSYKRLRVIEATATATVRIWATDSVQPGLDLKEFVLTASSLADGSVTEVKLADATITAAGLKANAAVGGKLTTDAFDLTDADQLDAWKQDTIDGTAANKLIADGAIGEEMLTADELDARSARPVVSHTASVADMSASIANRPGQAIAYDFNIADAAAQTYSFGNIPFDMRLTGVTIRKTGAAGAATDTVKVQTTLGAGAATDLFDAISPGAAVGDVTTEVTGWNGMQSNLSAGDDIDIVVVGNAGDRAFMMTLHAIRK